MSKGGHNRITPKQAAFALAFVETGNAGESYRRAYDVEPNARDEWIYVEACQLLDNPKVSRRIQELQDELARLSLYTLKSAFDEYEEARKLAAETKNPSAAVSAIAGKVRLFGLEQPTKAKVQHGNDPDNPLTRSANELSDKELAAIAAGGGTGASPPSKSARKLN